MKTFYEYEKAVIENSGFDLVRIDKYHYNDEKRGVWIECDHQDHLLIGYVDVGNELNVKNTKKYVEVSIRDRLGEKYLNIDFNMDNESIANRACISLRRGCAGLLSIYDIDYWRYNHSTEPVSTFDNNDFKLTIWNLKLKNYGSTIVPVTKFTTSGFVNAVCDVVKNIHDSKKWNENIDSLLELIKPVLTICGEGIKESWLESAKELQESSQRMIETLDLRIKELHEKRSLEVELYNFYKKIEDTIQNNEDKLENNGKNSDEYTSIKIK